MRRLLRSSLVVLLVLVCLSCVAYAETQTWTGSIPLSKTNWSSSITLPKFDPSLGWLTSIFFQLSGHVEGSTAFESLDSQPATVTMSLAATITMYRPDSTLLVMTIPVALTSDNVTAFDGVIDFGGTSGKSYPFLTGDKTESSTSPPPASDLALFTATFPGETITLPVEAVGASSATGAGNLLVKFGTSASADALVQYNYVVPEPAGLSSLVVGLVGLLGVAIRRRRS